MKQRPRSQLNDIPQSLRPETVEDAYGVGSGGYSNQTVLNTQRDIERVRAQQSSAEGDMGPARNVAVRGRFAQSAFNVTDVSLQILNSSSRRLYFLIQNLGPNDVYVNFGNKAQINNVKVIVNGNYEPFVCPMDSVSVICDPANTSVITVIEGVEIRPGGY